LKLPRTQPKGIVLQLDNKLSRGHTHFNIHVDKKYVANTKSIPGSFRKCKQFLTQSWFHKHIKYKRMTICEFYETLFTTSLKRFMIKIGFTAKMSNLS